MNGSTLAVLSATLFLVPCSETQGEFRYTVLGASHAHVQGKVFLTTKQALALVFPGCDVERTSVVLTEKQLERVAKLAGEKLRQRVVRPYIAKRNGKLVGTAYFDVHRVRTLREVLMVVVAPDHTIRRIEVLSFGEPVEYMPGEKWYAQFGGRRLDRELRLSRGIHGVTGATLTARATTRCARRILALHKVLAEPPEKKKETPKPPKKPGKRKNK